MQSNNLAVATFELKSQLSGRNGWGLIQTRNDRFQQFALTELSRIANAVDDKHVNLFAYSYAASRLFSFAKDRSWTTVLGQIDPGPPEERLVAKLYEAAGMRDLWKPAPKKYWDDWRQECDLADRILVNSDWSRSALISEGISESKISVVSLAFEPGDEALTFTRQYPLAFTQERPMKVLFLGQVNLRKGVRELLDAAQLLRGEPIEFCFVGPIQFEIPETFRTLSSIKWIGAAARSDVTRYYQPADVFVFPTHSDGFGLTQLEAASWKLPIVVSRNCGDVVQDGVNGLVLPEVNADNITKALLQLVRDPRQLQAMSDRSCLPERCSLSALSSSLLNG